MGMAHEIVAAVRAGEKKSDVARRLGVSCERVSVALLDHAPDLLQRRQSETQRPSLWDDADKQTRARTMINLGRSNVEIAAELRCGTRPIAWLRQRIKKGGAAA